MKPLALAAAALALSPSVMAQCDNVVFNGDASIFESNNPGVVPPDLYGILGSGIGNGNFTLCDAPGIQLGLRISERFVGPIEPVNGTGNVYVVPTGASDGEGRAAWNFEFHVDMGYLYGADDAPDMLSDLDDAIFQMDCDPTPGAVNGPAISLQDWMAVAQLPDAKLIQESQNPSFGFLCGPDFDVDARGVYELSLNAVLDGNVISEVDVVALATDQITPPAAGQGALFKVVTSFDNFSVDPATVRLTCNGGQPLEQDFEIVPFYVDAVNNEVTFSVDVDGAPAGTQCTVTADAVTGYTQLYQNLTGGSVGPDGCVYDDVAAGTAELCVAGYQADAVEVAIDKVWEAEDDGIGDTDSVVELVCTGVAPGSQSSWEWMTSAATGNETFTASVTPGINGASCVVSETQNSYVETSGCEDPIAVNAGDTTAGCTLVNTVFFEGIPTLGQYGLAIMALLMLGVGAVGMRRFV